MDRTSGHLQDDKDSDICQNKKNKKREMNGKNNRLNTLVDS